MISHSQGFFSFQEFKGCIGAMNQALAAAKALLHIHRHLISAAAHRHSTKLAEFNAFRTAGTSIRDGHDDVFSFIQYSIDSIVDPASDAKTGGILTITEAPNIGCIESPQGMDTTFLIEIRQSLFRLFHREESDTSKGLWPSLPFVKTDPQRKAGMGHWIIIHSSPFPAADAFHESNGPTNFKHLLCLFISNHLTGMVFVHKALGLLL